MSGAGDAEVINFLADILVTHAQYEHMDDLALDLIGKRGLMLFDPLRLKSAVTIAGCGVESSKVPVGTWSIFLDEFFFRGAFS